MDEYVGGISSNYMTNDNLLKKGLELLDWLQEDLRKCCCRRLSSINESMGTKT